MDLIRKILLAIEAGAFEIRKIGLEIDGHGSDAVNYHMLIMIDAGLIEGFEVPCGEGIPIVIANRMTWYGHDFLDACRDEGRWSKAKGIMTQIGGATLEIMIRILTQVMSDQVKQMTGI